jgi:hypothetical protein
LKGSRSFTIMRLFCLSLSLAEGEEEEKKKSKRGGKGVVKAEKGPQKVHFVFCCISPSFLLAARALLITLLA